ncbi:MAG: hypothetical protein ACREXR_03465 [Gammaproteobacteria bacterium]
MYQQLCYTPKQFDLSGLNVAGLHAFLLDYKPSGRPKYIEVLFLQYRLGRCRPALERSA